MPSSSPLAEAVRAGLTASPRTLPAALLYDELGSALFEAITLLPEYELTRADFRLLDAHAAEVAALVGRRDVVELGPGAGLKALRFLTRFSGGMPLRFTAVDVSAGALAALRRTLEALPHIEVDTLQAPYLEGLQAAASQAPRSPWLVLFLGSNLANLDRPAAQAFLSELRQRLQPGDALLLATDLDKDPALLLPAYDDAAGVTAAFNRNLLLRLNRELGADFDIRDFRHEARWDAHHRRVEMHLVAERPTRATLPALELDLTLDPGESIWTESSYRFNPNELRAWGEAAGFTTQAQWIDPEWAFAHTLYVA